MTKKVPSTTPSKEEEIDYIKGVAKSLLEAGVDFSKARLSDTPLAEDLF